MSHGVYLVFFGGGGIKIARGFSHVLIYGKTGRLGSVILQGRLLWIYALLLMPPFATLKIISILLKEMTLLCTHLALLLKAIATIYMYSLLLSK